MKYSYEEKLEIVLEVLEKHHSIHSVSKKTGIAKKTIRHWLAFYQKYGIEGLLTKEVNTHYSKEFKLSVLKYMHENHLSFLETAVKFGISNDSTIYKWYRIYNERGESSLLTEDKTKVKKRRIEKCLSELLYGDQQTLSKKRIEKVNSNEQSIEDLIAENEYLRAENAYLKKLEALVQERIARENKKEQKPSKN